MEAILWIWAITLVLALAVTVPILAVVWRLVFHAREIDRLLRGALTGALGIHGNTANIAALPTLLEHATSLAKTCAAIDGVAARIHAHGAAIVRARQGGA
jgi:hypothetical protein